MFCSKQPVAYASVELVNGELTQLEQLKVIINPHHLKKKRKILPEDLRGGGRGRDGRDLWQTSSGQQDHEDQIVFPADDER
ncbi:unnamed protein product [Echinostoma caproni]|uniref:Uncharacterized protein n=1 Tax=Echinostoma caproni TaxID=27848 RepID=A0A183A7N7_9TREM|nr:unnamed protein product [Echinostoma caproni]